MTADQPPAIVIAQDDLGGPVGAAIQQVMAARKSGALVKIEAPCASACTLWFALPPQQLCVGPKAAAGFHLTDPVEQSGVLLAYYPQPTRNWIERNGGLSHDVKWLHGTALRAMFKACPR